MILLLLLFPGLYIPIQYMFTKTAAIQPITAFRIHRTLLSRKVSITLSIVLPVYSDTGGTGTVCVAEGDYSSSDKPVAAIDGT